MRIITDAAADFTQEERLAQDVHVVPTVIMLDGKCYQAGVDLTEEEFWQQLLAGAEVKTSQPAPELFLKEFEAAKEANEDAVCLCLSGALSGTLQSARLAAEMADYDRIHIIDTLTGAAAQKLLVMYACRLRDEGLLKAREIAVKLEEIRSRVRLFASLDTLESLARSGRIPRTLASIGNLTQLKPLLTVDAEGHIVLCGKAFGKHRAVDALATRIAAMRQDSEHPVIPFYAYSRDNCRALLRKLTALGVAVDEKLISALGPAIAGHIGQNAYGIAFVEADC